LKFFILHLHLYLEIVVFMFTRKISKLLISAALSIVSITVYKNASAGELSSKAASELFAARQEYINAYQSLTNKSQKIEEFNTSAPNAILNLTGSAESLKKELFIQCEVDCIAIADSYDKMMSAKYEEKRSSLQRKIDEISNRFFGDAAREARWSQAREEVEHHFPNIEQEVLAEVQRKYGADYERAIAEARSAIQEEFSGIFSEYQNGLIAEYDRRFSQVVGELNARLTDEINQIKNRNTNEVNNIKNSCDIQQRECENKWQSAHRQRLNEIESWFKSRWNEIVNDEQCKMWGAWGQQAIQHQIQEAQIKVSNAQKQSYESCQIKCNNEIQSIVSRHQRTADDANNRAMNMVSQLSSKYQSICNRKKEELNQSIQQELDVYGKTLREQFSQRDLNSEEIQRITDIMSQEVQQEIVERCALLIRRCYFDKKAQASDLCQSLIAAENQNAEIEWEQFQQEAEEKYLVQITSIEESYQKRLKDVEERLYGAAGKIFEEYNQAQIAVNEAKRKFDEKGQKLVEAQSQEPNFMDELDEMDDSERTPSLFQALKESLINGFKNAIPIWTPTRDAMTAMDAIAAAAMEGRYEDIDENFNKVSQELVNLMRDTNDARYGFVIKPMIFEGWTKELERRKEAGLTLPRNHMQATERWTPEAALKVGYAKAEKIKDPTRKSKVITKAIRVSETIRKYNHLNPEGIYWSAHGYPDFKPYAIKSENGKPIIVEIELANPSNRQEDYRRASRKALEKGLIKEDDFQQYSSPRASDAFVWHHAEDGKTMILMPRDLHEAVPHSGGISKINERSL